MNSPLHQFRTEIADGFAKLNERLTAMEAAAAARGAERAKSAAKGADFEDLLEVELGRIARGAGDLLDRTGLETGTGVRSKKGDFVITLDAAITNGADVRIVVEAKDRALSMRAARDELREARENRGAAIGLMVFTPAHAPAEHRPLHGHRRGRLLRHRPRRSRPGHARGGRPARPAARAGQPPGACGRDRRRAVAHALRGIREVMESTRALKARLTSISTATKDVWTGLDALQANVLQKVCDRRAGAPHHPLERSAVRRSSALPEHGVELGEPQPRPHPLEQAAALDDGIADRRVVVAKERRHDEAGQGLPAHRHPGRRTRRRSPGGCSARRRSCLRARRYRPRRASSRADRTGRGAGRRRPRAPRGPGPRHDPRSARKTASPKVETAL